MNFLHVAWMHAGKLLKTPGKFRNHAGKNLVKLPCIFKNVRSFSLGFKKALQSNKSLEKVQFSYENL